MDNDNWFRNETWSPEVEEDFRARLKRARNKSQYLRIQASTLASTHPQTALELLKEYFALGDDPFSADAHATQAEAYLALGEISAAVDALETALTRETRSPSVMTNAYLSLPCLVAERRLHQYYARALGILDEHRSKPTLPVDHYRWHGAKALILSEQGKKAEAMQEAKLALDAALQTQSGFRYHPDLGLVDDTSGDFGKRLNLIVKAADHKRGFWRFWNRDR